MSDDGLNNTGDELVPGLTLRQLRCFLAVVQHQTVARAATVTRQPPSSISQSIRSLEKALDVALFHRIGRRLVLTQAGRSVADNAHAVVRAATTAQRSVGEPGSGLTGHLDVAANDALVAEPLGTLIGRLRTAHPAVTVRIVRISGSASPGDVLRDTGSELALCHLPVDVTPRHSVTPVGRQEFWLVSPPAGPPLPPGALTFERIPPLPLITLPRDRRTEFESLTLIELRRHVRAASIEVAQREAHLEFVMAGIGMALLERTEAERGIQRGAQARPLLPAIAVDYGFVHLATPLSPPARGLIEAARSAPHSH